MSLEQGLSRDAAFVVITAADGDELWIAYSGSFLFTPGATPEAGVSPIDISKMTVAGPREA